MFKQIRRHSRLGVLLFLASGWLGFLFTPTLAQAQTNLANVAASMQPGTWTQFPITGLVQALASANGSTGTIVPYAFSGQWDPVNRKIYFSGMDHMGGNPANYAQTAYAEATNTWTNLGPVSPMIATHAIDQQALDPVSGTIYQSMSHSAGTFMSASTSSPNTWTTFSGPPAKDFWTLYLGLDWSPLLGLVVYNCGSPTGQLVIRDLSGNWSTDLRNWRTGNDAYNCAAVYSQKHNVVVFGGGHDANGASIQQKKIWRLNGNKTITALPDTPWFEGWGIQKYNAAVDPVTGNVLFMGGNPRQLWELNPSTGVYTQLSGSRVPPSQVGNPTNPDLAGVISTPISTYGVILYVTCSVKNCTSYLYKHASGGTPPPPLSFDFSLSNGGNKSVSQGQTTSNTISANLISGTTQTAGFSVSGLPSGATGTFTQTSCSPTCSITLNISTLSSTATGNYTVNVTSVAGSLTKSTAFTLTVNASSTTPPPTTADFQTRCSASGVVRCFGFDATADFNTGVGGTNGAYGQNFGIIPPSGTSDYTRATRDTTISASGASSLKFTIPSNSGSDSSGTWFANFSSDLNTQFGDNSEFYIQWRQRFSPEMITNRYQILGGGSGGWKHVSIAAGDQPGKIFASCTSNDVPVQQYEQKGFPIMYNSCTGSASHGPYDGFYQSVPGDIKLQNGRPSPYCLYTKTMTNPPTHLPPTGNCFGLFPNEWMTFQVMIKTGPRVSNEFVNSFVKLWMAREGKPAELVIDWGPYNLSAGSTTVNERYGKIWFLPYHTNKDPGQSHPVAYTWYDELIISRTKIADPSTGSGTPTTPPAAPSGLAVH